MSLPNIPDISPYISLKRCETINLLLSSIALEEIGLSHILNAQGEKLQHFLKACPKNIQDFFAMNKSSNEILRSIVSSQILLQFKMEDVMQMDYESCCESCSPKEPACPSHGKKKPKPDDCGKGD